MKKNNLIVLLAFASGGGTIYHFAEAAKAKVTITNLQLHIDDLRVRLAIAIEDLSVCRRDSIRLEEAVRLAEAAAESNEKKLDKVKVQLERVKREKEGLESKVNELEDTIIQLREDLETKKEELHLLSSKRKLKEEAQPVDEAGFLTQSSALEEPTHTEDANPTEVIEMEKPALRPHRSKQEQVFIFFTTLIIAAVGVLNIVANRTRRRRKVY